MLLEIENVLKGIDVAFYLVHSMLPSANLDQGNFADYDLLLADNFARAANLNHIKQVIYLGGLLPSNLENLSKHLESRFEVEQVFRAKNFALTAFRAGLIIGPEGSSFKIMYKLVKRLPVMICPQWLFISQEIFLVRCRFNLYFKVPNRAKVYKWKNSHKKKFSIGSRI